MERNLGEGHAGATRGQYALLLPPPAARPATEGPALRDRRLRQMEGRACSL